MALLSGAPRPALLAFAATGALVLAACSDREHLNPLDPANPETNGVPWRFTAVAADRSVNLRWDPQKLAEISGFRITRSTAGEPDSTIAEVSPRTAAYTDPTVTNGIDYGYRLEPFLADGRVVAPDGPVLATPGPAEVWIADAGGFEVARIAPDARAVAFRITGFRAPNSVAVSARDGLVWVADSFGGRVVALDRDGNRVREVQGFSVPKAVSVSPADGSVWVADERAGTITRLAADGTRLAMATGLSEPADVAANPGDGSAWAADAAGAEVWLISSDGAVRQRIGGFAEPTQLAAVHADSSCWVADDNADRVVRVYPDGSVRQLVSPVPRPFGLAVDQSNEDLWVGSFGGGTIERYTTRGGRIDLIVRVAGFERPLGVAVDPIDAGLWVVDSARGEIVKLTVAGHEIGRVGGLSLPFDVDVGPGSSTPR
jgi:DNA-binding beta-propeller fold protein YncE